MINSFERKSFWSYPRSKNRFEPRCPAISASPFNLGGYFARSVKFFVPFAHIKLWSELGSESHFYESVDSIPSMDLRRQFFYFLSLSLSVIFTHSIKWFGLNCNRFIVDSPFFRFIRLGWSVLRCRKKTRRRLNLSKNCVRSTKKFQVLRGIPQFSTINVRIQVKLQLFCSVGLLLIVVLMNCKNGPQLHYLIKSDKLFLANLSLSLTVLKFTNCHNIFYFICWIINWLH